MLLEGSGIQLCSLLDYTGVPDIVEDGKTFFENALKKAITVSRLTSERILADDSGLEIEALHGAPGVHSARYAGEDADDEMNIRKLLNQMRYVPPARRKATFRCVLVLYELDGTYERFEGIWEGFITEVPAGKGGFGYDPIFFVPEEGVTVAQMSADVKNKISHRAQAMAKLKEHMFTL